MKILPGFVLAVLLLGAATLFAEPEPEPVPEPDAGCPFHLLSEVEVAADQVEALVEGVAGKPPWQARVEATFLRVDATQAADVLGEHRPEEMGSAQVIPASLARSLIGAVRGTGAVRPEPLPPLVLYAGQAGRLAASGRHTYIQDYDVDTSASPQAQPVIGAIRAGTGVEVTPRRQGADLLVDVSSCWAEVVRPIPRYATELASAETQVTIELPELRLVQDPARVSLPAGGGYVLAGRGLAWDGKTWRLVVLEIRPVKP